MLKRMILMLLVISLTAGTTFAVITEAENEIDLGLCMGLGYPSIILLGGHGFINYWFPSSDHGFEFGGASFATALYDPTAPRKTLEYIAYTKLMEKDGKSKTYLAIGLYGFGYSHKPASSWTYGPYLSWVWTREPFPLPLQTRAQVGWPVLCTFGLGFPIKF